MSIVRHQILLFGRNEVIDQLFKDTLFSTEFHYSDLIPLPESLEIENGQRLDYALDTVLSALNPENPLCFPPIPKLPQPLFSQLIEKLQQEDHYGPYNIDLTPNDLIDFLLCEDYMRVISLGMQALCNLAAYGHTDWYSWCQEHWGIYRDTLKSRCQSDKHLITFDTDEPSFFPVSRPCPPLIVLSKLYPSLLIMHLQSSLSGAVRTGISKYIDGRYSSCYYPEDGTEDAALISSYLLDFDAYAN